MSKNRRAQINYSRTVNSKGIACIRIDGFENILSREQLPKEYTDYFTAYFYTHSSNKILFVSFKSAYGMEFHVGENYTKKEFFEIMPTLKEAGNRLAKINKKICGLRAEWTGKGKIII